MLKERTNYFLNKKENLSLKAAKVKELKNLGTANSEIAKDLGISELSVVYFLKNMED